MPSAFVLLRCIGKAAVKNIVNLVSFGVGGDILVDAWDYWQKATREEQRPAEVQTVAQLSAAELRAEVARIVREEAAALPAAQQAQVASYLGQVPAMVRRSLRRPSDPTGTTIASGTVFRKPEDLLPLLPAALPRFKAGDRPAGIGDWELVELLGVGGFGEVWKARNPHFDGVAPVALKFCLDVAARNRLLKHEAAVLNQVMRQGKHEGIVPLLHTYLSADPPCLAYEYIDGGDLAGLIQGRRDGLSSQQAAQIIQRLAEIVGFAHRLSPPIVHRDLKPANILVKLRADGELALRITDFGIGGLEIHEAMAQSRRGTKSGEFLTAAVRGTCTPLYASPQQMRGDRPDPGDDVYSLGVIWYQLLTGDLTKGRPGGEAWRKHLADRGMTPELLALLASTYEDEREDRPANALVLAEKLGGLLRRDAVRAAAACGELVLAEKLGGLLRPSVIAAEALPVEMPRPVPPRPEQPRTAETEKDARHQVRCEEPAAEMEAEEEAKPRVQSRQEVVAAPAAPAGVPFPPRPRITRMLQGIGQSSKRLWRYLPFTNTMGDLVDCTVFAPPAVTPGETVFVQVFAHLPEQAKIAWEYAHEFDAAAGRRGFKSLEAEVERGAKLTFHLILSGAETDDPVQHIVWRGVPASVQFGVGVSREQSPGSLLGTVSVSLDSIPLGHVKFKLTVSAARQEHAPTLPGPVGDAAHRYRKAFISYASPDRPEVLKRVQMLARLGIDYFQDVLKLEPGDRWEKQLHRHIEESDLFLLFWSTAARSSKWVLEEMRYALRCKRGDELAPPEIKPIVIEGPPPPAPPTELAHLHFNDYFLYFMSQPGGQAQA